MKNKKSLLLLIPIAIGWIIMSIYFSKGYHSFKNDMKQFEKNEAIGILVSYKEEGRGFAMISLKNDGYSIEYDLPNFHSYLSQIAAGDSMYKPVNSNIINLYKKNSVGEYEYCCQLGPISF